MLKTERPWPGTWTWREARVDDAELVLELVNARSRKFFGQDQATREGVASFLTDSLRDLDRDVRLLLDDDDRPAGLAFVASPGAPYTDIPCAALAHPRHEDLPHLVEALQSWALGRAGELAERAAAGSRVVASAAAIEQDSAWRSVLVDAGFVPTRVSCRMQFDLARTSPAPGWPDGVSVRTASLAEDVPALAALYREAWREHAGYVERTQEEVCATFVSEIASRCGTIDSAVWFLACAGQEVVGMALCVPALPGDPAGGYIDRLGVRPAWRKRGIALALLHHAFAQFRERGYRCVELDVDSRNVTGAVRLYERAGMRPLRSTLSYEKELRPCAHVMT